MNILLDWVTIFTIMTPQPHYCTPSIHNSETFTQVSTSFNEVCRRIKHNKIATGACFNSKTHKRLAGDIVKAELSYFGKGDIEHVVARCER